jgi:hypothetical protein
LIAIWLLSSCSSNVVVPVAEDVVTPDVVAPEVVTVVDAPVTVAAAAGDCSQAKNVCSDYAPSWVAACPEGQRCLTFTNANPTETVLLSYQIGCNGDGTKGAPQCDCTTGPSLAPGASMYFVIVDGDYASCLPSWQPACLTAGLAVLANVGTATCAKGTRVEFTAGNSGDPFGKSDFWNIDIEKDWYSIPVAMKPDLTCATDHANHDCRPLVCDSATCPDAYDQPTSGGCGYSPQDACQDTFSGDKGVTITYFPVSGKSCQDATPCK